MPYITQDKRAYLDPVIEAVHDAIVELEVDSMGNPGSNNTEGNLNYIISRLLVLVYGDRNGTRYAHINDAMGLLSCIQAEYYRKVAAPYEDQKEFENGPVVGKVPVVEEEVVVVMTDEEREAHKARIAEFDANKMRALQE